jgi:predicted protein tyrosine phosphatase
MSREAAAGSWDQFDAVLTLEDSSEVGGLRIPCSDGVEQLVLKFDDAVTDLHGRRPPEAAQVDEALAFARRNDGGKLLVHCEMGVSRSAGIALAVLAERYGPGREDDAVAHLLRIRPVASCNTRIVAISDRLLGRDGLLAKAWEAADGKRFSGGFFIPPSGGASA